MDRGTPLIRYTDRAGDERRMVIRMESASAVPRFEQLRGQISVMVAVGRLEPGSRLRRFASSQPHSTWPPAPSHAPTENSKPTAPSSPAAEPARSSPTSRLTPNRSANAANALRSPPMASCSRCPTWARSRRDAQRLRRRPRPRRRATRDLNAAVAPNATQCPPAKGGHCSIPLEGGRCAALTCQQRRPLHRCRERAKRIALDAHPAP